MANIQNPHDKFFKAMLSVPGAAEEFMRYFLPKEYSEILDLKSLKPSKIELMDAKMSDLFMDVVFECQLKGADRRDLYISLLLEHKSNPYKYVTIQVGRYLMEAYQKQIEAGIRPLRPVIPMIYYHGEEKWTPPDTDDLFDADYERLKVFIPSFRYLFRDLKEEADEEIGQIRFDLLKQGILLQKYFRRMDMLSEIGKEVFRTLSEIEGRPNYKEQYYVYISTLFKDEKPKLMEMINDLSIDVKDNTMHLLEEIEYKGEIKKALVAVKNMLKKGYSVSEICEILEVDVHFVEKVRAELKGK